MSLLIDPPPDLLNDPTIAWYVKDEQVYVRFATEPGVVQSSVGPNAYHVNDALITGSNGDQWAVTPANFRERYQPEIGVSMGQDGYYRNYPVPIKATQMASDFSVRRRQNADWLAGKAGDWLVQYSVTDYGIVDQKRFAMVYAKKP